MRIELPARPPFSLHSVIRTILTTNTAWSGTIRMNAALVALYGDRLPGAPAMQAFPTPQRLAAAGLRALGPVEGAGVLVLGLGSIAGPSLTAMPGAC